MANSMAFDAADDSSGETDDAEAYIKLIELDSVFRPTAPIDRDELFSGRKTERWSLFEAIRSTGSHAVIYGERGVGKTSLAATIAAMCDDNGYVALRVTCDVGDNFNGIWQKFTDECSIYLARHPDHKPSLEQAMERAAEVLSDDVISPAHVRVALRHILTERQVVVFLDELDQVVDVGTLALVSNLIKMLSDQIEPATIIPMGVAESVDGLISGHQSIGRNLVQVRMPRMSRPELREIAAKGFDRLEMRATPEALNLISSIPKGFPQYAHMLAQEGARQALMERRQEITARHVIEGLDVGMTKVEHSLARAYDEATYSAQVSRFKEVLLGCVLATTDEFGYFSPADVRAPYSAIVGEDVGYERFNPNLIKLSQERGQILTQIGPQRRHRYRFTEPLMEPYVLLRGLESGMIDPELLLGADFPPPPGTQTAGTTEQPPLF